MGVEVTPDDMLRNLEADLATCETAPSGPWTRGGNRHESNHPTTNVFTLEASVYPSDASEWAGPLFIAAQEEGDMAGWAVFARDGWPAALRRAIAAEGEADRLRNVCHALEQENRILREDVKGIIDRECETLAQELADVRAERDRLQAILDQPVVMLFADGREPTTNERHLANLLSWRQHEATEAKVEAGLLHAELANIREAARAVLGVLRDRLDGTADEHLVDRLQAVGQGGVR